MTGCEADFRGALAGDCAASSRSSTERFLPRLLGVLKGIWLNEIKEEDTYENEKGMGSTFSWSPSFGWLLLRARGGEKRGSSFSGTGLSVSAFAAEGFLVRRLAREPVDFVDLLDRAEPTELTEASDSFPDISDSDLFLIREERLSGVSTLKTTVIKKK